MDAGRKHRTMDIAHIIRGAKYCVSRILATAPFVFIWEDRGKQSPSARLQKAYSNYTFPGKKYRISAPVNQEINHNKTFRNQKDL